MLTPTTPRRRSLPNWRSFKGRGSRSKSNCVLPRRHSQVHPRAGGRASPKHAAAAAAPTAASGAKISAPPKYPQYPTDASHPPFTREVQDVPRWMRMLRFGLARNLLPPCLTWRRDSGCSRVPYGDPGSQASIRQLAHRGRGSCVVGTNRHSRFSRRRSPGAICRFRRCKAS